MTGLPRRYYSHANFSTFDNFGALNEFISIIAIVVFLAQFVFLFNFFYSIWKGKKAESDNPWDATTLEWSTPTPPRLRSRPC